jgi:hypothetical protein
MRERVAGLTVWQPSGHEKSRLAVGMRGRLRVMGGKFVFLSIAFLFSAFLT